MLPEETVPGEHIRLPYAGDMEESDAFIAWLTYLRTQISVRIPVMVLKPVAGPWMDAIVGKFDGKQLLCLRSSLHHSPPVTELKYNIPAEFRESVQKQLTSIADWDQSPHENTIFEAPVKRRVLEPKKSSSDEAEGGFFSKPMNIVIAAVILVIVVAGAIIFALSLGNSGDVEALPAADPAEQEVKRPVSDGSIITDPARALAYLADAESLWYPRLMRYTRNQSIRANWIRDPDLADLIQFIESSELISLIENVGPVASISPSEIATMPPEKADSLIKLAQGIHGIEKSIDSWKVSADRDTVESFLKRELDGRLIDELNRMVPVINLNDRLGEQIQNRLEKAPLLAGLADSIRGFSGSLDKVQQSGMQIAQTVTIWCDNRLVSIGSLQELPDDLSALQRGLATITPFLDGSMAIDQSTLMADSRYAGIQSSQVEQFDELAELIQDYQPIPGNQASGLDMESLYGRSELQEDLDILIKLDPDFNPQTYLDRWREASSGMEAVNQIPAIKMNASRIREGVSRVRAIVDSLKLDLGTALAERSDPNGWYTALGSMAFGNPSFNEAWLRKIDEIVPESSVQGLTDNNAAFIQKRQEMEAWRTLFERTLAFADTVRYPGPPAGANSSQKERNAWISDFHAMLVSMSLVGFLEELAVPIQERLDTYPPLLELREEFKEGITSNYTALEAELNRLESDLNARGTGDYPELQNRISAAWPSVEPGAGIPELMAALRQLESVKTEFDPNKLIGFVSNAEFSGQRWAAWRNLKALPNWPASVADLNQLNRIGKLMQDIGLEPEAFDSDLKAAWQSAILSKPARSDRLDFWGFHEALGWKQAELPLALQYDRLISLNLDKAVLQLNRDDVIELRDNLIAEVSALGELKDSAQISGFLRELENLHFEEGKTIDRELLTDAGPGVAGWDLLDADPEGKWVIYSRRSENLRFDEGIDEYQLAFVLVEPFNQERFYLAADEISSGAFFDWISESVGWDDFPHTFPQAAFGSDSLQNDIAWRNGPRAWTLGTDSELYVARDWQIQSNTQEVPVQQDRDRRPSRLSPVNYISAATASAWADSINCRLPSPKEFTALPSTGDTATGSNLRDATWAKHLQFVQQQLGPINTSWPDNDIFIPSSVSVPAKVNAVPAVTDNDRILWFTSVGTEFDDPVVVRNIRGNMAEFVYDAQNDTYFVIGASALSPAEIVWNAPYRIEDPRARGYSDVGLRIAFDAPTQLPGRVLLDALINAPQPSLGSQ